MAQLAGICIMLLLCPCAVAGAITAVNYAPQLSSYNLAGKVTSNTAVLQLPRCYFNSSALVCSSNCQVYLVPAVDPAGVNNFNTDQASSNILSLSPYASAFTGSSAKNYYLTLVGSLQTYVCQEPPGVTYFRVGAAGNCSGVNCNGVLPAGSTVRFKYVVLNSSSIISETMWSSQVLLYSAQNPASIDDGIHGRSAGMIVITTILSVLLALLLLFLIAALIYKCCFGPKKERVPALGSLQAKRYDTHNVKEPRFYVNQSFEDQMKKYATSEVLPATQKVNPDLTDSVKLKRYQNIDIAADKGQNS